MTWWQFKAHQSGTVLCVYNAVKSLGLVRAGLLQSHPLCCGLFGFFRVFFVGLLLERHFNFQDLYGNGTSPFTASHVRFSFVKESYYSFSHVRRLWSLRTQRDIAVILDCYLCFHICVRPTGSSRFDWSDRTPWWARREGRPRFARTPRFFRWQGWWCK